MEVVQAQSCVCLHTRICLLNIHESLQTLIFKMLGLDADFIKHARVLALDHFWNLHNQANTHTQTHTLTQSNSRDCPITTGLDSSPYTHVYSSNSCGQCQDVCAKRTVRRRRLQLFSRLFVTNLQSTVASYCNVRGKNTRSRHLNHLIMLTQFQDTLFLND